MKRVMCVLCFAAIVMFSTNAMATSMSYWEIVSSHAEYVIYNPDSAIEFGVFSVDDYSNPTGTSVQLTTLFTAGAHIGAQAQMLENDWDVFGFYVKNINNDRIWLSDSSINGTFLTGDLSGLTVRQDTYRFQVNPALAFIGGAPIVDSWNFSFTKFNGQTVRLKSHASDISPVPEPTTLLLLGSGLVGLAFLRRRKS